MVVCLVNGTNLSPCLCVPITKINPRQWEKDATKMLHTPEIVTITDKFEMAGTGVFECKNSTPHRLACNHWKNVKHEFEVRTTADQCIFTELTNRHGRI